MRKHREPTITRNAALGIISRFPDTTDLEGIVREVISELAAKRASFTAYNVTHIVRKLYPNHYISHHPTQGVGVGVRQWVQTIMYSHDYDQTYESEGAEVNGQGVLLFVPFLNRPIHKKLDPTEMDRRYNPWKYEDYSSLDYLREPEVEPSSDRFPALPSPGFPLQMGKPIPKVFDNDRFPSLSTPSTGPDFDPANHRTYDRDRFAQAKQAPIHAGQRTGMVKDEDGITRFTGILRRHL